MKPKAEPGSSASATGSADRGPGAAIFEELVRFYDSRISALKQTRDAMEEAKPVLTPPDTPGGGSDESGTSQTHMRNRALLAMELLVEMIDEMTLDLVFETHFELKQSMAICSLCNSRCQSKILAALQPAGADASGAADMFECGNCQRSFPAPRFASHMDKCMGLSSRRTATRRSAIDSAASTPSNLLASYDSSSEQSTDRKRKLGAAKDATAAARKKARRKLLG
ncbi:hypothetical protein GGI07_003916 [Coemansia sp. Benny D115]|nr:hypothetical protein GGI07_003916 [Coemansia sp. Benny D115]